MFLHKAADPCLSLRIAAKAAIQNAFQCLQVCNQLQVFRFCFQHRDRFRNKAGHVFAHIQNDQILLGNAALHGRTDMDAVIVHRFRKHFHFCAAGNGTVHHRIVLVQNAHRKLQIVPNLPPEENAACSMPDALMQQHPAHGLFPVQQLWDLVRIFRPPLRLLCREHFQRGQGRVSTICLTALHELGKGRGADQVITVQQVKIFSLRLFQPDIPGIRLPPIGFMEYPDAAILHSQFITKLPAAIGRAIVYQKQLPILVTLRLHALDTVPQIRINIIDRHNDRYKRFSFLQPDPSTLLFSTPLRFFIDPSGHGIAAVGQCRRQPCLFAGLRVQQDVPAVFFHFLPEGLFYFFMLPVLDLE